MITFPEFEHVVEYAAEWATGCADAGGWLRWAHEQGYEFTEELDLTSSAGDWSFAVSKDGVNWYVMYQSNNFPKPGFTRVVDEGQAYYGTLQEVVELIFND
jgi:hypothetical protein